jgi:hypothetical protein
LSRTISKKFKNFVEISSSALISAVFYRIAQDPETQDGRFFGAFDEMSPNRLAEFPTDP